jgi:hypothetical protein
LVILGGIPTKSSGSPPHGSGGPLGGRNGPLGGDGKPLNGGGTLSGRRPPRGSGGGFPVGGVGVPFNAP